MLLDLPYFDLPTKNGMKSFDPYASDICDAFKKVLKNEEKAVLDQFRKGLSKKPIIETQSVPIRFSHH
jgi:hypothetical protein